jgi:O-antigen/teichoic acid export membrane protein
MSAGLPGLGLGGIFFVFSAILAVPRELWRTARGRSSVAAWRVVARQFAQAVAMIAVVVLLLRAPLLPIALTVGILALVLGTAALAAAIARRRRRYRGRRGVSSPLRGGRLLAALEPDGDRQHRSR